MIAAQVALSGVQALAFLGLAALAGAGAGDLVFGRLDRRRARDAELRARRLERRLDELDRARTVRRRQRLTQERRTGTRRPA